MPILKKANKFSLDNIERVESRDENVSIPILPEK